MAIRLRGTMLYVADFPRMKQFYTALLGAAPTNTQWTDEYAEYDAGGASFALHAIPADIAKNIAVSGKPRETVPVKWTFEIPDLESEKPRLEALGATLIERPWGAWDAADPEGNVFGLHTAS